MKTERLAVLAAVFLVLVPQGAYAGNAIGNGMEYLRTTYERMGRAVLEYLQSTAEGKALAQANNLSVDALQRTLNKEVVAVSEEPLLDESGVEVDTISAPGKVTISRQPWIGKFDAGKDSYSEIFHHMLTASRVDDQGGVISAAIKPFPADRRVNSYADLLSLYPILSTPLPAVLLGEPTYAGTGCPRDSETFIDLDPQRGILNFQFERYFALAGGGWAPLDRKNCSIALPLRVPKNTRAVIQNADLRGIYDAPKGSTAKFTIEAFMAGSSGQPVSFAAPASGRLGNVKLSTGKTAKSACGEDVILRLNTSGLVQQNRKKEPVIVDVDQITLRFALEPCRR